MAATDIKYGNFDPVLYTPDFTFLRYIVDKSTANYEKGLKDASSSFNNLKKELSDSSNVEKRDAYLKNANAELQKISSSDLSLQQNVNYANSIFDPIATDKAIAYDAFHTQRIKTENTKEEQWKNSEDPEERKKYNPQIQQWLMRDLDSIKNGKGDINNYKVQNRSAFAAVDAQDILNQAAAVKGGGFKYEVDSYNNPYIVTTTGGKGGTENYTAFAENVLANDPTYMRQLEILATNKKETIIESYRKNPDKYPEFVNANDDAIYKDYAKASYIEHKKETQDFLKTKIESLNTDNAANIAFEQTNLEKLAKGANDANTGQDTPESRLFNSHVAKLKQATSLSNNIAEAQENFEQTYGGTGDEKLNNYVTKFTKDPGSFFINQSFNNDVTRFSNIRGASVTKKIKEDRAVVDMTVAKTNAYKVLADVQNMEVDNATDQQKLEIQRLKLRQQGKVKKTNADGTTSIVDVEADYVPVDESTSQITVFNQIDAIKNEIETQSSMALNGAMKGMSILESMGLSSDEVGVLKGALKDSWGNTSYVRKQNESTVLTKLLPSLMAFNPGSLKEYQGKKITVKDVPDMLYKAISGFNSTTQDQADAKLNISKYKSNMELFNSSTIALQTGKDVVIASMKSKPEIMNSGYFINRGTKEKPNLDIVNEKDIKSWLSPYLKGNDLDLMVADYFNGGSNINIKNPKYYGYQSSQYDPGSTTFSINGRNITVPNGAIFYDRNNPNSGGLPPEKYNQISKKITSQISIPDFTNKVGKVYGSPIFKVNGEPQEKILETLSHDATSTNNSVWEKTASGKIEEVVDPVLEDRVRTTLKTKNAVAGVNVFTSSTVNNGKQAVNIAFTNDLKGAGGKTDYDLSGRQFFFPINPTDKSSDVFHTFERVNEITEFDRYRKKGDTFHMDTFKTEGIRVELRPDSPGSNIGNMVIFRKQYNPTTNTYSDTFEQDEQKQPYDLTRTTYNDLETIINSTVINPYVNSKLAYYKKQSADTKANGGTYTTSNISNYFRNL